MESELDYARRWADSIQNGPSITINHTQIAQANAVYGAVTSIIKYLKDMSTPPSYVAQLQAENALLRSEIASIKTELMALNRDIEKLERERT